MLKIDQGFLCYDEKGVLGLVTSNGKVKIDETDITYFTGIVLNKKDFGTVWKCDKPHIAALIDLNTGNIKLPNTADIVQLPNSTIVKVIPAHEYGLK